MRAVARPERPDFTLVGDRLGLCCPGGRVVTLDDDPYGWLLQERQRAADATARADELQAEAAAAVAWADESQAVAAAATARAEELQAEADRLRAELDRLRSGG